MNELLLSTDQLDLHYHNGIQKKRNGSRQKKGKSQYYFFMNDTEQLIKMD